MTNNIQEDQHHDDAIAFGRWLAMAPAGQQIVISGMSGSFPSSRNVAELRQHLFDKMDMVNDEHSRWTSNHPEIPQRTGKIYDIDRFDAGYFGVHYRQAESMDPMVKVFLERALEAIMDAGVHPDELRGTRTAVYVGSSVSESERHNYEELEPQRFGITGCMRTMIPHRLSYHLKLEGPSMIVDTACSSSLYALEQGYRAIRSGICEAAIIGGCHVCLNPFTSLQFSRLGVSSPDGACKVFDISANGYARSETIGCLFLQKANVARRVYATVLHAKTNTDGFKPQGITFPSKNDQQRLLEDFYTECPTKAHTLSYLEAHGTGTTVGDPEEVAAIDEIFTPQRTAQLLIGSVKSNLGHSEPGASICSLVKVIIAMESGWIPPNIHFHMPKPEMVGILAGRLKVVTEKHLFEDDRGIVGVNAFGFGGSNSHVLLKWNDKAKGSQRLPTKLPRLVCISGRTQEAVTSMLDTLLADNDIEQMALVYRVYARPYEGHRFRGYSIIEPPPSDEPAHEQGRHVLRYTASGPSPLHVHFGSALPQWRQIADDFKTLPSFMDTFNRITSWLREKDVELLKHSTEPGTRLENSCGTVAIMLSFAELLRKIGLQPTVITAHSLGHIGQAYLDSSNQLHLEQAIACGYEMALSTTTDMTYTNGSTPKYSNGSAVGAIAHTTSDSSHRHHPVEKLMEKLVSHTSTNTDVCHKLAASMYGKRLADVETIPPCSSNLKEVLLEFSERWMRCSPDPACHATYMTSFLRSLGECYVRGHELQLDQLYPKVEFPVSRGTPMLSPAIKWDHKKSWFVCKFETHETYKIGENRVDVTKQDPSWQFIAGHEIDDRHLFPATGYLNIVWRTLADCLEISHNTFPVVFEDCRFIRATNIYKDSLIQFTVMIQRLSGRFEIIEGGSVVATGRVMVPDDVSNHQLRFNNMTDSAQEIDPNSNQGSAHVMNTKDIYKELRLRGYNYTGVFRGLVYATMDATQGAIRWHDNWISFMDSMLQLRILDLDTRLLYVPTYIRQISIDVATHMRCVENSTEQCVPVYFDREADVIRSGGIEIRGACANSVNRRRSAAQPVLERHEFIPYIHASDDVASTQMSQMNAVRVCVQIILENTLTTKFRGAELLLDGPGYLDDNKNPPLLLCNAICRALGDMPLIQCDLKVLLKEQANETIEPLLPATVTVDNEQLVSQSDLLLVCGVGLLQPNRSVATQCVTALSSSGYILTLESERRSSGAEFVEVSAIRTPEGILQLMRRHNIMDMPAGTELVNFTNNISDWIKTIQSKLSRDEPMILCADQADSGILGFVNCLRRECKPALVRCVWRVNGDWPLAEDDLWQQLEKGVCQNVWQDGQWGSYRHLPLEDEPEETEDAIFKGEHCFVDALNRGDLSSLQWLEGPLSERGPVPIGKTRVRVHYGSLNFRDVVVAGGRVNLEVFTPDRLEHECTQGVEFSGVSVANGQRLMGVVGSGAIGTLVDADTVFSWPVPGHWSLAQAATVPIVYSTLIYGLFMRHNLRPGQSILIHAGSGGIGLAAIHLAIRHQCTVFTTVGSAEKRAFIHTQFPTIPDSHIGDSRSTSFEQMIKLQTNGRGVDVVINSLAEDKLLASVRCLASGGHFIELGKFDLLNNHTMALALLEREVHYHGAMLDQLIGLEPYKKQELHSRVWAAICDGWVVPLPYQTFGRDQVEQAYRLMASGRHMGKVLIEVRDESTKSRRPISVRRRFLCRPNSVHVVVGGLGGIGLELADWLVLRGCRRLVMCSRAQPRNGYQAQRLALWAKYGVQIQVCTEDLTTAEGCRRMLTQAGANDVQSIFNLAVRLKDGLFENQTVEQFAEVLAPKVHITHNLDQVSRELCPQLQDFVVFSSVSCGRGNTGQTNYGLANSIMEQCCKKRRAESLPGLAIQWGAIGDVGLVADMQEEHGELVIGGTLQQRIASCLNALDSFMKQSHPVVASMVVAEKKRAFGESDNIAEAVANILGIRDIKTVSFHSPLAELGLDSMTGLEIKQILESEFDISLTAQDIRTLTFAKLFDIQQQSKLGSDAELKSNQKLLQGLQMFFRIAPDLTICQIPFRRMRTQGSGPPLIVFPGFDGLLTTMENITQKIHADATGLQYVYTDTPDTIPQLALNLLKIIDDQELATTSPYNILCYSFGSAVALEVAAQLETRGMHGNVFIVDSSPDMMRDLVHQQLPAKDPLHFQTVLICHFLSTFLPIKLVQQHQLHLATLPNLDAKMDYCETFFPTGHAYCPTFPRFAIRTFYTRLQSLIRYQPVYAKLQANTYLFRARYSSITYSAIDGDLKLSKVCAKPVQVQVLDDNHETIVHNDALAVALSTTLQQQQC